MGKSGIYCWRKWTSFCPFAVHLSNWSWRKHNGLNNAAFTVLYAFCSCRFVTRIIHWRWRNQSLDSVEQACQNCIWFMNDQIVSFNIRRAHKMYFSHRKIYLSCVRSFTMKNQKILMIPIRTILSLVKQMMWISQWSLTVAM